MKCPRGAGWDTSWAAWRARRVERKTSMFKQPSEKTESMKTIRNSPLTAKLWAEQNPTEFYES